VGYIYYSSHRLYQTINELVTKTGFMQVGAGGRGEHISYAKRGESQSISLTTVEDNFYGEGG
jgi:hypothetical protein